jgi:hypothetical protein
MSLASNLPDSCVELTLEVGFSPYYIGYLHPKFDCCEDQLNETKTALKMPIKDNSLMGIFYFESHHDVGALDENSRLLPCSSRCSVPVLLGPGSADVVSSVWRERSRRAPAIRHFWAPTDSAAEIPSRG